MNRKQAETALRRSGLTELTAAHLADVAHALGGATGENGARVTYTHNRGWHVETIDDAYAPISPAVIR